MPAAGNAGVGGRHGPYWRRQLGITNPGEYTQEELNMINQMRRRLGQPPLGGQSGAGTAEHSPFALGGGMQARQRAVGGIASPIYPGGSPNPEPHRPIRDMPMPIGPPGQQGPPVIDTIHNIGDLSNYGQGMQDIANDPNALGGFQDPLHAEETGHADLRQMLLRRLQGRVQPMPGRRVGIVNNLRARQVGPRQPILPQRRAVQQRRHAY